MCFSSPCWSWDEACEDFFEGDLLKDALFFAGNFLAFFFKEDLFFEGDPFELFCVPFFLGEATGGGGLVFFGGNCFKREVGQGLFVPFLGDCPDVFGRDLDDEFSTTALGLSPSSADLRCSAAPE